jgi:hypothetical protein
MMQVDEVYHENLSEEKIETGFFELLNMTFDRTLTIA